MTLKYFLGHSVSVQSTSVWSTCHCYNWFWNVYFNYQIINRTLYNEIGPTWLVLLDIDCLNRIEKSKIPLEANEPCFWIIYNTLVWLCQIFHKKIWHLGVLYFDSHCTTTQHTSCSSNTAIGTTGWKFKFCNSMQCRYSRVWTKVKCYFYWFSEYKVATLKNTKFTGMAV